MGDESVGWLEEPAPGEVGIVMGSASDWPTMQRAAETLAELEVGFEARIVSAHRTSDLLYAYGRRAEARGLAVLIAGAGGAAHLPGMLASMTVLPVLGVPVQSRALRGIDSLLSIAQMPAGVAVGTLAIGEAGAANAGLLAAEMLAHGNPELRERLRSRRDAQTQRVLSTPLPEATPEDEKGGR